ncbi:Uncharacterised protein [uncultured archaeon]|nr:Uncharacterised protein [uncultured archaeon]
MQSLLFHFGVLRLALLCNPDCDGRLLFVLVFFLALLHRDKARHLLLLLRDYAKLRLLLGLLRRKRAIDERGVLAVLHNALLRGFGGCERELQLLLLLLLFLFRDGFLLAYRLGYAGLRLALLHVLVVVAPGELGNLGYLFRLPGLLRLVLDALYHHVALFQRVGRVLDLVELHGVAYVFCSVLIAPGE